MHDALAGPRALFGAARASIDLLSRADEIERSVGAGATEVVENLDEITDRLRPVQGELDELRRVAVSLQSELRRSREELSAELRTTRATVESVSDQLEGLQRTMAQLEGSIEHVIDRVPGLSATKAAKRGDEIASAD